MKPPNEMKPPKKGKSQATTPQSSMQEDGPGKAERADHGLDPQIQAKIAQKLRAMYDEVVREGIPDRFVDLLRKIDKPSDEGHSG